MPDSADPLQGVHNLIDRLCIKISRQILVFGFVLVTGLYVIGLLSLHTERRLFLVSSFRSYLEHLLEVRDFLEITRHLKSLLKEKTHSGAWLVNIASKSEIA